MKNEKLLDKIREVYGKYTHQLKINRDQVFLLLGNNQNLWSGLYRESLIKDILKKILPIGVNIEPGFIYGFDEVRNSKQLDIIVWDSNKHSPIFKTDDFVILSPESVISVISVKTGIKELENGLDNLSSIIALDYQYKFKYKEYYENEKEFNPISKYLIFFKGSSENMSIFESMGKKISNYYCSFFCKDENGIYKNEIINILEQEKQLLLDNSMELFRETMQIRNELKRYFPRIVFTIDEQNTSFYFGVGENSKIESKYNWVPNVYKQINSITTPFEKFIFYLLQDVYEAVGIKGTTVLCAWSDISPKKGWRDEDVSELDEESGLPLINL